MGSSHDQRLDPGLGDRHVGQPGRVAQPLGSATDGGGDDRDLSSYDGIGYELHSRGDDHDPSFYDERSHHWLGR